MSRREFSPDVRHAALVRAGYRCEKCGSRGPLELHHIGNRQDRSAFNAMVLCVRCHAKLHAARRDRFGGRSPPAWSGPQA
jgi:5-methylcytosine-specific restriction endonuclease McrA